MSVQPAQPNRNQAHNPRVAPIPVPSKKGQNKGSTCADHHFSPKPLSLRGLSPVKSVMATVTLSMLFFTDFGEDSANQANRKIKRLNNAQISEFIFTVQHLESPLPWERQELDAQIASEPIADEPQGGIHSLTTVTELLQHLDGLPSQ